MSDAPQIPPEATPEPLLVPAPPKLSRTPTADTGLKNYTKWSKVANSGKLLSRFVPMKLPYDLAPSSSMHNMAMMKRKYPNLSVVLDLQNQEGVYDVAGTGVERQRVTHESKVIPSLKTVAGFIDAASAWLARVPGTLVAVHCHYGFNRTGFLLVSYLVEREGWDVDAAIAAFAESRPPGIKHQHFKDELRRRYARPLPRVGGFYGVARVLWGPWPRRDWFAALFSASVALVVLVARLAPQGILPRKLTQE